MAIFWFLPCFLEISRIVQVRAAEHEAPDGCEILHFHEALTYHL